MKEKSITASRHGRLSIRARSGDHRVPEARRDLGLRQALGIRLEIEEPERIAGAQRGLVFDERVVVGQLLDALERSHREVMAALRTDP